MSKKNKDYSAYIVFSWAAVVAVGLLPVSVLAFDLITWAPPLTHDERIAAFTFVYMAVVLAAGLVCFAVGYGLNAIKPQSGMIVVRIGGGLGLLFFLLALLMCVLSL